MHPQIIGRDSRRTALDALIRFIRILAFGKRDATRSDSIRPILAARLAVQSNPRGELS
jgi:hypothetical protein